MIFMTKPKKPKSDRGPGRPSKFPKEADAERSKRGFNITLSPLLADALEAYRTSGEKRERSEIVEKALEMYLASKGAWPPNIQEE